MSSIKLIQADCMEYMRKQKDQSFDLAIIDPPYGLGISGGRIGSSNRNYKHFEGGDKAPPSAEYFDELKRVSKNQIIFGANHFCDVFAANSKGWIVWDKYRRGMTFADCELAYTSFNKPARVFDFRWNGALQGYEGKKEKRIHPTQKPVALYEWLLMEYAKEGDRILDTHLGSGSSALAAHNLDFDFVGVEMSEHYYKEAKSRLTKHKRKPEIFYYEAENDQ